MLDEVDKIKKRTQKNFTKVILNATDLNITVHEDKWAKEFFKDLEVIFQAQTIAKIAPALTILKIARNNKNEAFRISCEIIEETLLDLTTKLYEHFMLNKQVIIKKRKKCHLQTEDTNNDNNENLGKWSACKAH